ncbi:MAG: zinc ribbon domain-containing protein [Phycisphaerae bacterium]|nr:zinc ribbon domain-containing protein [Phycisphaerae bacterium]
MPTYDYHCEACEADFELFQPITAKPIKKCPQCGKSRVRRLIGAGAGIIFKGSGFYQTDYRSDSYAKDAEKEKSAAKPEPAKDSTKPKADSSKPADKKKK